VGLAEIDSDEAFPGGHGGVSRPVVRYFPAERISRIRSAIA
jgi:hypothetical protein